eukprot:g45287.t1
MAFVRNLATKSCVYREYSRELRTHRYRAPVLSVIMEKNLKGQEYFMNFAVQILILLQQKVPDRRVGKPFCSVMDKGMKIWSSPFQLTGTNQFIELEVTIRIV